MGFVVILVEEHPISRAKDELITLYQKLLDHVLKSNVESWFWPP